MDTQGTPSPNVIDRRRIARRGAAWFLGPMLGFLAGRAAAPSDRDADLVQVTSVALDRGQRFWRARVPGWRDAAVVLVDAPHPTACGLAGVGGPFYCPADGRIYLDLGFLRAIDGDLARAYVIAHELGHHVQAVRGTRATGVDLELEADCLAGTWLASQIRYGLADDRDLSLALAEVLRAGDATSCPGCAPEQWAHGSGEARVSAVRRGLGGVRCGL